MGNEAIMVADLKIDESLMADAKKYTGLATEEAVIEEALRTLVRLKSQEQIRELRGKLHWQGDLNATREEREPQVPEPAS